MSYSDHGDEPPGSVNVGECVDCRLLKNVSSPRVYSFSYVHAIECLQTLKIKEVCYSTFVSRIKINGDNK
jgi:hypothetical protein